MSTKLNKAILKVAQQNPEFKAALQAELGKTSAKRPYVTVDPTIAMVTAVMPMETSRQGRRSLSDLKMMFARIDKIGDAIERTLGDAGLKPSKFSVVLDPRSPTSVQVSVEARMVNEYNEPIQSVYDALKAANIKYTVSRQV